MADKTVQATPPAVLMQTAGGIFIGALVLNDFTQVASGTEFLFAPVLEGGLIIALFALIGVGIHLVRRQSLGEHLPEAPSFREAKVA